LSRKVNKNRLPQMPIKPTFLKKVLS